MQILNLTDVDKSDIKWSISRFPDGEIQITLGEFSHKDEINVRCRITNTEDVFILMQVTDILTRHEMYFSISIYYFMGMRMDRVMDFNRPYTLKIVVNILDNLGAREIHIFTPHSNKCLDLFRNTPAWEIRSDEWESFTGETFHNYQTVLPDEGAVERYYGEISEVPNNVIIGEKVRDIETGKIISIKVKNPEVISDNPLLIVDDLCDGGGTFVGLVKAIRGIKPDAKVSIAVNHMVNLKGIENLSKNFEHVWFSNSYKDWNKIIPFPENITQINVI